MTCIAAVTDGERVWMGGDSAVSCSGILGLKATGKVFRRGEFLLGTSGGVRYADLLRYVFEPPKAGDDLDAYMVREFAPALRKCLTDAGRVGKDDYGCESAVDRCLVGVRGRLYDVDSSLAVTRDFVDYGAIGSGCEIALGVLYATARRKPEARVMQALAAAERWTTDVRRPFTVESV